MGVGKVCRIVRTNISKDMLKLSIFVVNRESLGHLVLNVSHQNNELHPRVVVYVTVDAIRSIAL